MRLKEIIGRNFILRELRLEDSNDFFEIANDFETTKYISWGPFSHITDCMIYLSDQIKTSAIYPYAIIDKKTKKMIGKINYHTIYENTNTGELGFILNKSYWNKGIMTACLKEMIKFGFEDLNLNKIIVGHVDLNESSKSVIKKCGFQYEFKRDQAFITKDDKSLRDIIYYSLYKIDYERGILL